MTEGRPTRGTEQGFRAILLTGLALVGAGTAFPSVNREVPIDALPQVAGAQVPPTSERKVDRPNIVMIFTDDQRADTLGCMGQPWARTPYIDRLAREGVLFENAFVITSLCCPSRATVLSGQYTHVHGVSRNTLDLDHDKSPFLPALLQKRGYTTAFIGKYHLGGLEASALPRPGFDHWAGIHGQGKYVYCRMNINGQETKTSRGEYLTDILAGMAVDWIQKQEKDPFFLLLSLKSPHGPLYHAGRYDDLYQDRAFSVPASFSDPVALLPREVQQFVLAPDSEHGNSAGLQQLLRLYALMIPTIDDAVAAVYHALEDKGILDQTVIIFSSDNGHLFGEHHIVGKGLAYDPSIRVPMIIRYPRSFKPDSRSPRQVLNIDLPPTILEAAGIPVPPAMQGESLQDLFNNGASPWRTDWLYLSDYTEGESPPILAVRHDTWKYVRYRRHDIQEEFFDLSKDPEERQNLRDDPAYEARLNAARTRMRELMAKEKMPASWWDPIPPLDDPGSQE